MQMVVKSYEELSFLVWINADRIFTLGTVIAGLLAGAYLGQAIMQP